MLGPDLWSGSAPDLPPSTLLRTGLRDAEKGERRQETAVRKKIPYPLSVICHLPSVIWPLASFKPLRGRLNDCWLAHQNVYFGYLEDNFIEIDFNSTPRTISCYKFSSK
jgi:hypothetical protein